MKSVSLSSSRHLAGTPRPHILDRFAKRVVLAQLERLQTGSLRLSDNGEDFKFGAVGPADTGVHIQVLDPRFYSEIAFGGSIGAGEAYMQAYWQCDDLV